MAGEVGKRAGREELVESDDISDKSRAEVAKAPMNYYFYNTDANSLSRDHRFPLLIEQGFAATSGPERYGEQLGTLSPGDRLVMYENRLGAVAVGTVLEFWDHKTHSPARYYQPGDDGFEHEYQIKVNWFLDMSDHPITVEEVRRRMTYIPQGAIRKIVKRRAELERMIAERTASLSLMPEEVATPSLYVEGASQQIAVNAYERSPLARMECIRAHGSDCSICGFNFGALYGSEAEGYIHVHHIRPLSEVGGEYVVNPVEDLRPVCPNCHAVLHLGGRCRTLEEVRQLLGQVGHG